MKRFLAIGCVICLFALLFIPAASAANAVSANIAVSIAYGGTAVITPQVNCPVPAVTELSLGDGEVGAFHIEFSEEGTYTYTIHQRPDDRELTYDDSVFTVRVFVEALDGALTATIVVYNEEGKKVSRRDVTDIGETGTIEVGDVTFSNVPPKPDLPTEPTAEASSEPPSQPMPQDTDKTASDLTEPTAGSSVNSSASGTSNPKTGDDSTLENYLFICIAAAAGLFILSLMYHSSVNRLIKGKR